MGFDLFYRANHHLNIYIYIYFILFFAHFQHSVAGYYLENPSFLKNYDHL